MEDSDALYEDLETNGLKEALKRMESTERKLEKKNVALKKELDVAQSQVKSLSQEKKILETNILSIWETANVEICRKDKRIKELLNEVVALKAKLGSSWLKIWRFTKKSIDIKNTYNADIFKKFYFS